MNEKSKFQKDLEQLATKRILASILIGCLFFCAAIVVISTADQYLKKQRHLDAVASTFRETYDSIADYLTGKDNTELFINNASKNVSSDELQYLLSRFNLDAPVGIHLLITNAQGELTFSSFSKEDLNLHRLEFNRLALKNAQKNSPHLYSTVYYFSGDTSEYVIVYPLFRAQEYVGSVSAYLKEGDWGRSFLKYQYDTIITASNSNIIYCSNTSLLSEHTINKYRPDGKHVYQWINGNRYLTGTRYLEEPGIYIYSYIYSPVNYSYMLIGTVIIFGLGIIWAFLFFRLLQMMASKTSESVQKLVEEIRIIRKGSPNHVIVLNTGDEIEEIADQINKMVANINELNQKNLDLLQINNRMEMQNLQAQINPHFIYNTLENIRYLIVVNAQKADALIEHFTHILRYSINNTKHSVTLQEDMEYIEDYLFIQKTRFGKRFEYEIDIAPECERIVIPKLLMQPLIENSLKYGFKKKANISVSIRGWIKDHYMFLQIADDGPGQPRIILESIRNLLRSNEINTVHNGLQNINRRVILEYGQESGLSIESEEGEYFIVTLKLWIGGQF